MKPTPSAVREVESRSQKTMIREDLPIRRILTVVSPITLDSTQEVRTLPEASMARTAIHPRTSTPVDRTGTSPTTSLRLDVRKTLEQASRTIRLRGTTVRNRTHSRRKSH